MSRDVIIIGGGIMGASAAFFLRRRGKAVTLIERGLLGQQASGTNFGNVRRQGRHLNQLPLANRARAIWGALPELIGEDCEFLASGHLRVAYTRELADRMEQYARDARDYGLDLELINGNALRARYPYLGREVIAGSLGAADGHANPRLTTPAFGRAAAREGAEILENTQVLAIERVGGDFEVQTTRGSLRAGAVLVTAGAWGGRLSAQVGEPVPLAVHGPQMAVTEPLPYRIGPTIGISTDILAETMYFRQVSRGNVVYGGGPRGPALPDALRAYVEPVNTLDQMTQMRRAIPGLAIASIIRVWSGIESYLPDDLPIMGPSARVPGLFYAFGFCGAGFQVGPGVGDVMAELIATGATSTPIEPYSIARFATAA